MREQFEAAMRERWPEADLTWDGDDYRAAAMRWAWFGWQAKAEQDRRGYRAMAKEAA